MKLFTAFILLFSSFAFSQDNVVQLDKDNTTLLPHFKIAADKQYSLRQVISDRTIPFREHDDVTFYNKSEYYWIKCSVKNSSDTIEKYYVYVYPDIDNTMYFQNPETNKWESRSAGFNVKNYSRLVGMIPYTFTDSTSQSFYFKISTHNLNKDPDRLPIEVSFKKAAAVDEQANIDFLVWFTSLSIIMLFFLYNLYIYFIFKDKAYLYYLVIQLGALFYITSYRRFLNILFDERYFYMELTDHGLYSFDLNILLMQIALILIITGFVQYARTYLETSRLMPVLDTILKTMAIVFTVAITISSIVTLSGITFLYRHSVTYTNLLIVAILVLIFIMGIISWRKNLKQARYFLLANLFPMIIVVAITITFLLNRNSRGPDLLPNIAIISQTLAFALALVARINIIKEELKAKELESELLRKDNEQIQIKNRLIALENEYVNAQVAVEKSEKEKLHEKLEFNQRELASTTLYLFQKNEMLTTLQKQIEELPKAMLPNESIQQIKSTIKNNLFLDADWEKFKLHFEKVHPDFFLNLKQKHPTLTAYEIRLCAYFHLQLSPKEIAGLLNINPTSVHRAKTRLNKKMNLPENPE